MSDVKLLGNQDLQNEQESLHPTAAEDQKWRISLAGQLAHCPSLRSCACGSPATSEHRSPEAHEAHDHKHCSCPHARRGQKLICKYLPFWKQGSYVCRGQQKIFGAAAASADRLTRFCREWSTALSTSSGGVPAGRAAASRAAAGGHCGQAPFSSRSARSALARYRSHG